MRRADDVGVLDLPLNRERSVLPPVTDDPVAAPFLPNLARQLACRLPAALCGAILVAASLPAAPPASSTQGFVVTRFVTAMYEGKTGRTASFNQSDGLPECPQGFTPQPDTDTILADLKLPPAERERLKRPENYFELGNRLLHRGADGADVCLNPRSAPDPGFNVIQSPVAYGLDLDGSDGTTFPAHACPHENFMGPDGQRGIDNQLYRALGCIRARRQGGYMHEYFNALMRQGDHTILLEINGVEDLKNDADVQVTFYSAQDAMVNNVDGVSLSHASLRVHHDRHYRAATRGRIAEGVLTTDPVDVFFKASVEMLPYHIRDARLRVQIKPDGTLTGVLGGYHNVATIYEEIAKGGALAENEIHGPMSCPGLYYALQRLADGYPDIPGGQCEWISAAYELEAIPAFVIHPKEGRGVGTRTAQAQGGTGTERWWRKLLWWQ